ncbi:MAG TPA: PIN domain-containing protein [Thermoanaerobaculia bacterium]|nr:PIN domain-containing protein [Thermoanaerobaculia bacterium]
MILIDTSALIDCLTGPRRSLPKLREIVASGEEIGITSLVLYEWLRGPRTQEELTDQEALLPRERQWEFGGVEAAKAAELYRRLHRARGREIDIAIAAAAIARDARLWTLNPEDFKDIQGLDLV